MRLSPEVPLPDALNVPRRKRVRWVRHGLNRGSLYVALGVACRLLPRRLLYFFADYLMSPLVVAFVPVLRRAIRSNLAPVDPNITPLRVLRAYSRNLVDTFFAAFPRGSRAWRFESDTAGDARFKNALASGRGAIIVSPHLGNWDIGARSLEVRGYRFHVVAQPESDPTVDDFRRRSRHDSADLTIHAGSTMSSFFRVRSELAQGGLVLMLGDRAVPGDRALVNLFGRRAAFSRGPAVMSHLTGAPIVPAAFVRCGDGLFRSLSADPIVPQDFSHLTRDLAVVEMTQRLAGAFEDFVRDYPEQWFNFYPYWEDAAA